MDTNTRFVYVDMVTYNVVDNDTNYSISSVINLVINISSFDTIISILEF